RYVREVGMASAVLLALGTRKGLWLATSRDGRASWSVTGPHHPMTDVYAVAIDTRRATPRLLAGVTSEHFGPSVVTSDDVGATWREAAVAPIAFPQDTDAALSRVWQLAPGPANEPDVVYAGVEPSALVPFGGRRPDVRLRRRPVGSSAPAILGAGRRRQSRPHGPAAPERRAPHHRGDVDGRRLRHRRRR
nr:hypothetical protein [Micromonospora sp. DSM 115978]